MIEDKPKRRHRATGQPLGVPEVHGGAGAVRRITEGLPLVGVAALAEQDVRDQLATDGRLEIMVTLAARLQAATNLYWNAVQSAAETGDLEELDKYIKRFGWLATGALRAWAQIGIEQKAADNGLDAGKVLEAMKHEQTD